MTLEETRTKAKELGVDFRNSHTKAQIQKNIDAHLLNESLKKGIVSKEQLKAWKSKHGKVFKIEVEVSADDIAVGYLKQPNRDHKAVALTLYAQNKILETGEFLLQNCWLGGDDRLQDGDEVADSAAVQANSIVNFLKGSSQEV